MANAIETTRHWSLVGPDDEDPTRVPDGCFSVTFINDGSSRFSVNMFLNGHLGLLGPNREHSESCKPGDRVNVKPVGATSGQFASGKYVFR